MALEKGDRVYIANSQFQTSAAMQRAIEIHANLPLKRPSLIYLITIFGKRFMLMPSRFCNLYMPNGSHVFFLEDECGKEYKTKYWWKRLDLACIVSAHKLVVGDAILFQLVQPFKFKVWIVRESDLAKADGTINVRNSADAGAGETDSEENLFIEDLFIEDCEEIESGLSNPDSFVDIKNFQIVFNGSCIDSKLPQGCKVKYYELCRSRRSYLHNNLLNSLNPTLASEIIVETTNIADLIRDMNICPAQDYFVKWNKTLNAFEMLGMDVAFLRAHLIQLENIAFDPKKIEESKKLMEFKVEQDRVDKEIIVLQKKLEDLKNEIEGLEMKDERHKLMLIQQASAPW